MIILRSYCDYDKPVELIMRLEEGMQEEGVSMIIQTIHSLPQKCLPNEKYAKRLPEQLKKQPQRLLLLWLLLLKRYEKWQTIPNYVTAFSISLEPSIDESLVQEAQSFLSKDVCSRIRKKNISSTMRTIKSLEPYKEKYSKEESPTMWRFITNMIITIYETQ